MSFYPFALHEISVLIELILGHLRYYLTDVPPQPNSPPDSFFNLDRRRRGLRRSVRRYYREPAALLQPTPRQPCGHVRPRTCIADLMLEASRFREILPN